MTEEMVKYPWFNIWVTADLTVSANHYGTFALPVSHWLPYFRKRGVFNGRYLNKTHRNF